jgi:hypothetical protein
MKRASENPVSECAQRPIRKLKCFFLNSCLHFLSFLPPNCPHNLPCAHQVRGLEAAPVRRGNHWPRVRRQDGVFQGACAPLGCPIARCGFRSVLLAFYLIAAAAYCMV